MLRLSNFCNNWEFVAFYYIEPFVTEKQRKFYRTEIMRNVEEIYQILRNRGHKIRPKNPEETLQRTIQNMRDKGWINFMDRGEYEITDEGYKILLKVKRKIQYFKDNKEGDWMEEYT